MLGVYMHPNPKFPPSRLRGPTIKSKFKWDKVGNKCFVEFFKSIRQNDSAFIITELRDNHARGFTKRKDLDRICHDLYIQLYNHKDIFEVALRDFMSPLQGQRMTPSHKESHRGSWTLQSTRWLGGRHSVMTGYWSNSSKNCGLPSESTSTTNNTCMIK